MKRLFYIASALIFLLSACATPSTPEIESDIAQRGVEILSGDQLTSEEICEGVKKVMQSDGDTYYIIADQRVVLLPEGALVFTMVGGGLVANVIHAYPATVGPITFNPTTSPTCNE